jgi:hypothetical protein
LRMRIWDEVRDKQRVNPLSPLVRLAPFPESDRVSPSGGEG